MRLPTSPPPRWLACPRRWRLVSVALARTASGLRTFLGRPNPFDDDQDDYWTAVPLTAVPSSEQLSRMRSTVLAALPDRRPLENTDSRSTASRKDTP